MMVDKDFPRYLFPSVKSDTDDTKWSSSHEQDNEHSTSFDQYGICERIIKLNYSCPVRIDLEASADVSHHENGSLSPNSTASSKIRCVTHKYQSSDFVRPITSVMPWRLYSNDLRPKAGASYYHILSLSSISQKLFQQIELATTTSTTTADLDELIEEEEEEAASRQQLDLNDQDEEDEKTETLPRMQEDLVGDIEEAPFFYFVVCNKVRAKFFPALFARGNKGKCIFTSAGLWMTAVQFKIYSGSNAADWRHVLKLVKPSGAARRRQKEKKLSLKTLIDQNKLPVHPPSCLCPLCSESDFVQSQNLQLFSTFFLNSFKELYTISPNMKNSSHLDVNVYISGSSEREPKTIYDFLEKVNYQILGGGGREDPSSKQRNFKSLSRTIKWTTTTDANGSDPAHYAIKQIMSTSFEDEWSAAAGLNDVYESFVSVNLNDSKLTTLRLESLMSELDADHKLQISPLYTVQFANPFRIKTMACSPMIRGECALLLDDLYDIYLVNEQNATPSPCTFNGSDNGSSSNRLVKVASSLHPLFEMDQSHSSSASLWRHLEFGAHPRSLIYADYSQLASIDSRIRTAGSQMTKELFRPSSKWLDLDEVISRCAVVPSDPSMHLVCCSKTLLVIDERYPGRPLLSWKHHLDSNASFLNCVSLPSCTVAADKDKPVHMAILSDSNDIYMHQFSTKLYDAPVSHNFVRKLNSAVDLIDALPSDYEKRVHRNLTYRLQAPIISLSTLQYRNSFALFQMLDKQDVYYECFQVEPNESPANAAAGLVNRTKKGPKILNKWLTAVKSQSFKQTEAISLEAHGEEMNQNEQFEQKIQLSQLFERRPHHLCGLCNNHQQSPSNIKTAFADFAEDCPRCGLSLSFTLNLLSSPNNLSGDVKNDDLNSADFRSIFGAEGQHLEGAQDAILNDNFTQSIYQIWQ